MGLLSSISSIFRRSASDVDITPDTPRQGAVSLFPSISGDAMCVAAVYRCVNLLSDKVATLPLQYMRRKNDIFVEDVNSNMHYLLNVQPNAYMSAFDMWKLAVQYLLLNGNAYIVPRFDSVSMDYSEFILVDPYCVSHNTNNNTYTINDVKAGVSGIFDEAEIIHIKNYTRDGKVGLSTLAYARLTADIALTSDRETLSRFENGGSVRGLVSNDTSVKGYGQYQDKQLQKTAVDLDSRFRGGERIVSLPGDAQFHPIALSSADMQFLESRRFTVREIARFFGVHPSYLFDDTSNNYKSAEQAAASMLSDTIDPLLKKIEKELHRKLITPSLCCKRKFRFDRRELMTTDLVTMVDYQTKTIAAGISTVNEWRIYENKEPIEGGDNMLVSANLKSINELTNTSNQIANGED